MRTHNHIIWYFVLLLFYSCTSGSMNKEDAERSLKVLNSDLVNFGNSMAESTEMKVWAFLLENREAPIPFYKNSNSFISVKNFRFEEMNGIYKWNSLDKKFDLTGRSEQIIILPDSTGQPSLQFIVSDFNSEKVSSGEAFPTSVKIQMKEHDREIWKLDYRAELVDEMPKKIDLKIKGKDYSVNSNYLRTKNGETGTLSLALSFNYLMKTLIDTRLDCKIGYSRQGYFLKTIDIDQQLFDHQIKGKVDYASIDPTAEDYTASFNSHSKVFLAEKRKGRVGDVILEGTENNELNDFFVRFADNSTSRIGDFLPLFDKMMNLKY